MLMDRLVAVDGPRRRRLPGDFPAAPPHDRAVRQDLPAVRRARELLQSGQPMVWDTLTREFEAQLIRAALETTRGRRIEAAHKLGIGRNTITRKIQELGLDEK
jgi:two-component system nitrogen regulation response regulator GlnG